MTSKVFCATSVIVLATLALSSSAWAACSSSSVTGLYGFLGGGTNSDGTPTAILIQLTFEPSTNSFSGPGTESYDGVIETGTITGQYTVATNCTVTGTETTNGKTNPFSAVVTSTGGLKEADGKTGGTNGGLALAQGSPTCTNAGIKGSFGLQASGAFVAGAPFTGPVILIGELAFTVNSSGDGVITGHVAGSENGTILTFKDESVTGSYSVNSSCTGTATITPKGDSALNFSFVIVDSGKQLMAIETDNDTVVTATFQR